MTADPGPKYREFRDDAPTPASLARQALGDAAGDVVKATEIMVTAVRANPALYRALMDPLVKNACYVEIRKECGRQNLPSAGEPRKQMEAKAKRRPRASSTLTDMRRECRGIGQGIPATVPEHVQMDGEGHLGPHTDRIPLSNEIAAVCPLGGLPVPPPPFWSGMLDLVGHVGPLRCNPAVCLPNARVLRSLSAPLAF
jgi:hypothetical protein